MSTHYKVLRYPLTSGALRASRLCDMKGTRLEPEHKAWLNMLIADMAGKTYTDISIKIVGFAAKRGDQYVNAKLSIDRAWAVSNYIFHRNPWLSTRIDDCHGWGELASEEFGRDPNTEGEDDYIWSSVIVQAFGKLKPPPPPSNPDDVPNSYPGASSRWSMVALPSLSFVPIGVASVTAGLYLFRKEDMDRTSGLYGVGLFGFELSPVQLLKKFDKLMDKASLDEKHMDRVAFLIEILKTVLTAGVEGVIEKISGNYALQTIKPVNKFRHKDLHGATMVINDTPLLVKELSVHGKLPIFSNKGKVVNFIDQPFFEVTTVAPKISFDPTSWSLIGGPLFRLK